MNRALSIEEMAVLLVAGIGEAALASMDEDILTRLRRGTNWESMHGHTFRMFDEGVTFERGIADIKSVLHSGGDRLREQLRETLGPHALDKVRDFLHQFVLEIATAVEPRQLVVLVDDLEKFTVFRSEAASVYQEMSDLFFFYSDLLKLPRCHTVYTVPPPLVLLNPGILDVFDGRVHLLPNVKIQSRPPKREPYAPGIGALAQMIAMRVDLDRLFGTMRSVCTRRLVLASGGHLRDLASLTKDVVIKGLGKGKELPLGILEVEDVIAAHSARRGNLCKDDLDILLEVSKFGDLWGIERSRLGALMGVMGRDLMLCYESDGFWYDVNPAVAYKIGLTHKLGSYALLDA
ncbi:MAG: hypothetical protein AAGF11_07855 [Myxococcota bacterium]